MFSTRETVRIMPITPNQTMAEDHERVRRLLIGFASLDRHFRTIYAPIINNALKTSNATTLGLL